jgi:hypothetical protein
MARVKVFGTEATVTNLVWSCDNEAVADALAALTEANRRLLTHPHQSMRDNVCAVLMEHNLGAEILELDPSPTYAEALAEDPSMRH